MQTRELPVGPIGIIGLNTLSNADGRLNGTAIVVCGHAIHALDTVRNGKSSPRYEKLGSFFFFRCSCLLSLDRWRSSLDCERSCYMLLSGSRLVVSREFSRENILAKLV